MDKKNKRPVEQSLKAEDLTRVIEMAWEDRTPFEAIEYQFGMSEKQVIDCMRSHLKSRSFRNWRKRVNSKVSMKHLSKRSPEMSRFHCKTQYKPK
tara:strand:+ start:1546 stop:1830 length:285 start_codon:yes stop_codon:yes gene_type:complete